MPHSLGSRGPSGLISPSGNTVEEHAAQARENRTNLVFGTWNVRSLNIPGKLLNVCSEMKDMNIDLLGLAETYWDNTGEFETNMPISDDVYKVLYSGGNKCRKGVAFIINRKLSARVINWQAISERIIMVQINTVPNETQIFQIYAPTSDSDEIEIENFYGELQTHLDANKKYGDRIIIMGDCNARVGKIREENICGPWGLGEQNCRGERLIDFCKENNLTITNTWFQQKETSRYTWRSPDGRTKNQIDYIMINNRYRNNVTNAKARPGADCGSDHNPVIIKIHIKLKKLSKRKQKIYWNTDKLKQPDIREKFANKTNEKIENLSSRNDDICGTWNNLKLAINEAAEEICGMSKCEKKQHWMTDEILQLMTERKKYKNDTNEIKSTRYKELNSEIQRRCREEKSNYWDKLCNEIEELDKRHSPLLHKMIKSANPVVKNKITSNSVKDKDGEVLTEIDKILQRWEEYVKELYDDPNRKKIEIGSSEKPEYIMKHEIELAISKIRNGKSPGADNIPIELVKSLGNEGTDLICKMINMIYSSRTIPDDFVTNIFTLIPKVKHAKECGDYRTISLISHASKILLQIIKDRITPIIERELSESQMGFRKGRGTRDAIHQLRTLTERALDKNKKVYLCFIDYQKAFDLVNHEKLIKILEDIGVPETERSLIKNLYWEQNAVVNVNGNKTEKINIRRGVRQGCILSPILFNLYSEKIFQESLQDAKGFKINGKRITNIRYADDTVIIAETEEDLQDMINAINLVSNQYNMKINRKKTKVMIIEKNQETRVNIKVDNEILEQVYEYCYLGSLITFDCCCEKEIQKRIGIAKSKFQQFSKILKSNIQLKLKERILNCYVYSALQYACETWTWNKALEKKVNAFEMWCYRAINKIKWTDKISNEKLLKKLNRSPTLRINLKKRKLKFAGHIIRGSAGDMSLLILEGYIDGVRGRGRPRLNWFNDIQKWAREKIYAGVKRIAEDRAAWKSLSVNLQLREEDTH